jgi:predicted polyphosphate/ATP-dependent NAD kinase
MGGAVGLKGTDGLAEEAAARGAKPLAAERARACLRLLAPQAGDLAFFTASGDMGESALKDLGINYSIVYQMLKMSSADDTRSACRSFIERSVDLILFCGGDGTARDVANAALEATPIAGVTKVPLLGIPAGVKMHSGVFAISPEAAAELTLGYACGDLLARDTEIVDVDEELYRGGELQTKLYATARTPYKPTLVQERKRIYASANEEEFKDEIALFAREFMRDGSTYILGAGTTTSRIAELMGLEKTLLGVDVVQDEKLMIKDASERDLLDLLERKKSMGGENGIKIIVSPIGAQGFILGRGSQQISASVLKSVGSENLIIVSTPHKLAELTQLLVYTGDLELDKKLSGRMLVVTGYRMAQRKEVVAASSL